MQYTKNKHWKRKKKRRSIDSRDRSKRANLQQGIERNPEKKNVGEKFEKTECRIHHPIGQPLCVIVLFLRFDSLNAVVSINEQSKSSLNETYEQYAG